MDGFFARNFRIACCLTAALLIAPLVTADTTATKPAATTGDAWYQGGTLHQASALEWQVASDADKLATAGGLIAIVLESGRLVPMLSERISGLDDVKVLSEKLVVQLNEAFEPDPDPAQNQRMFANQKVASTAVMLMTIMGWVDTGK